MSKIAKQAKNNNLYIDSENFNKKAVEKVKKFLPEIEQKQNAFARQNSQTTLSLMTLTMLGGHSPYRMLRQILCEIETRKSALVQSQISHAKIIEEIEELKDKKDAVSKAKCSAAVVSVTDLEKLINGSFKDIAVLIDRYNEIKKNNNIKDWDEKAFEIEEKKHHVRRAFELMYRNILDGSRANTATIEYCQQFGLHPQVCFVETCNYVSKVNEKIENNEFPHANDLEDFLDSMGEKYYKNVEQTIKRLFGVKDIANYDYMYRTVGKK